MSNDFFTESVNSLTFVPQRVTNEQARKFMEYVKSIPTNPNVEFTVTDIKTGSRIYYNL